MKQERAIGIETAFHVYCFRRSGLSLEDSYRAVSEDSKARLGKKLSAATVKRYFDRVDQAMRAAEDRFSDPPE